jgi:hypothetical protein
MTLSLSILKQSVKLWSFGLVATLIMLTPFSAFSQDEPQEQQEEELINSRSNSQDQQTDRTVPVVGGNPWENSAGSTIGTNDVNSNNASSTGSANRAANRPGAAQRGDPGGNPDVPFDSNMNLVFLAAGLVFAFWVGKKRLSANTAKLKSGK